MSAPKLSTHALDLHQGRPARGLRISLSLLPAAGAPRLIKELVTNQDGRTDDPLLQGEEMEVGTYELLFHVGDYFAHEGVPGTSPPFLNQVPIRFSIANAAAAYHVPLLFSLWAYSTYRGS